MILTRRLIVAIRPFRHHAFQNPSRRPPGKAQRRFPQESLRGASDTAAMERPGTKSAYARSTKPQANLLHRAKECRKRKKIVVFVGASDRKNCGFPFSSSKTTSPSSTRRSKCFSAKPPSIRAKIQERFVDVALSGDEPYFTTLHSALKSSYFNSKIQSECDRKVPAVELETSVESCGSGTQVSLCRKDCQNSPSARRYVCLMFSTSHDSSGGVFP